MKDSIKLVIFIIFVVVLSIIDSRTKYKQCIKDNPKIIPEMIFHRLIGTFIYFGWIFDNKIVLSFYLILETCILIHWITNRWKCCLTEYENKVCGFDDSEKYDYVFKIFTNKTAIVIALILKAIIVYYVVWKLFFRKTKKGR